MTNRPLSVSVTSIFILLNALIWLAFGIIVAANVHPALPDLPIVKGIMAFMAFAAAGILLAVFIFIGKRSRIAYFIALGVFVATSFLIFFDDFGLVDLAVLAINIAPIIFLIKDRTWYLDESN